MPKVNINWPNGIKSISNSGTLFMEAAANAGVDIPYGCLVGSCGACEIEVDGEIVRACVAIVPDAKSKIDVDFSVDPYW